MKRIWGQVLSLCAATLGIAAVTPSCAVNDQSIYVRQVLAPSTNRQNGSCIYTDDPQQPVLPYGVLDVGLTDNYTAFVLVGNQMAPRADSLAARAESNRAHLQGAVVQVKEPGGALIREFTANAAGFADPGANNNPDFGIIGVTLVDAPTTRILGAQILAATPPDKLPGDTSKSILVTFKVFGKTVGNVDLESGEYDFPIRVCLGCLVSFRDANDETAMIQPNCGKPLPATSGTTGACQRGQEEAFPCQSCARTDVCDPLIASQPASSPVWNSRRVP